MNQRDELSVGAANLPPISVVLAVRNEETTLDRCIESLVKQDYPQELIEILLIDGMSTDRTPEVIKSWVERDSRIRAYQNSRKIVSAGMNLGLSEARHDLILWVSGHAILEPNHLRCSVATMRATAAAAVGGVLRTVGPGAIGRANAAVLSSPFGVGRGAHRVGTESGWVPAVTMALYRKQAILAAGGFDESLPRNQDNDLHDRMNRQGLRSYLDVKIRPTYICRDSFSGLLRQAWSNGYWNVAVARMGSRGFSVRHFVPMAFVFAAVVLIGLAFAWPLAAKLLLVAAVAYGVGAVVATMIAATQHRLSWQILILPFLFFALHLSYGVASWVSLLRPRRGESISG